MYAPCNLQQHLSRNCWRDRASSSDLQVERALTSAWFDEQKRLTPDELQAVKFPLTRLGRRGYEEAPVNGFLRQVHAEFVRLVNERASLWQEVQRLRRRLLAREAVGGEQDEALFGLTDVHVRAVQKLSGVQVTADRYVADVQTCDSRVSEETRLRRPEILREAQERSDLILRDAHAKAREAAISALNGATLPQTDRERRAAQAELAYLRAYSAVYREHLRAYTEAVLGVIDEWERKEAASLREAASAEEPALGRAEPRSIGQ
jgi:DivIVA domain-containing protein